MLKTSPHFERLRGSRRSSLPTVLIHHNRSHFPAYILHFLLSSPVKFNFNNKSKFE